MPNEEKKLVESTKHLALECFSGAICGICGMAVGYPFDTLKVLAQREIKNPGIINLCKQIQLSSGKTGFFKGLSVPMLSYTLIASCSFGTFNFVQKSLDPTFEDRWALTISSCVAGTVQLIPAVPMETIKTRIQVTADRAASQLNLRSAVKLIYKERGLFGFYAGLVPHAIRDIPGFWIYFTGFILAREQLNYRTNMNNTVCTVLAGAFGGISSWVITYPFDIIKTRRQARLDITWMDSMRFFKTAGKLSLLRGIHICIARSLVADGTMFAINGKVAETLHNIFT